VGVSRLTVAATLVAAAALLAGSSAAASSSAPHRAATLAGFRQNLLIDINAFRLERGLAPVRLSSELDASAARHSLQMARAGYFGHASPDGRAFWRRIGSYYTAAARRYWSVGENLLWSAPSLTAARALRMWERSPQHLANLLAPRWREVGISAVHVVAAPGVFGGRDVTIVTADFGVRR
jgi:uncharacterized protein YkwD